MITVSHYTVTIYSPDGPLVPAVYVDVVALVAASKGYSAQARTTDLPDVTKLAVATVIGSADDVHDKVAAALALLGVPGTVTVDLGSTVDLAVDGAR
jgi:hypothetical protein